MVLMPRLESLRSKTQIEMQTGMKVTAELEENNAKKSFLLGGKVNTQESSNRTCGIASLDYYLQ